MCGRYALALTPAQVRQRLSEQSMPSGDNALEDGGQRSPRQTYNFAPGYYGIVYRAADIPGSDAGSSDAAGREAQGPDEVDGDESIRFKLQSMKWGLVPSWTKKSPDYRTTMKTINCRAESLSSPGGMWSTIKSRKRCVVIAQGFYEWLKTGPKDKLPHYVKRKDDQLMCFAGLWDCAYLEGSDKRTYTYTIITTDANDQMKFLHNRMPVILNPGSAALRCWLDPQRNEWSRDLQCLLKPFPEALDIYPVTKEVGKVGNDSPSFITPRDSQDNKSNIANYFSSTSKSHEGGMKRCGDHNANTTFTLKRKSEEEAEWPMKKGRPNNVKKEKKEVDAQKITDFFLKPQ